MNDLLLQMLAQARHGGFSLEVMPTTALTDTALAPLHEMSKAFMAEPFEHFAHHATTNDELHVFRRTSGELVGFQFWRTLPGLEDARQRFVLGGKLRIVPEARRQGLHLASGLAMLLGEKRRSPDATITRLGVASLFGFVSVVRRLARYEFVTQQSRRQLVEAVEQVTRASRFRFDPLTGLVQVGIFVTPEQLACYPPAFFETPAARAYITRNPQFRNNGCYLAYAFEVDTQNLTALARGTAAVLLGEGEGAVRAAEAILRGG